VRVTGVYREQLRNVLARHVLICPLCYERTCDGEDREAVDEALNEVVGVIESWEGDPVRADAISDRPWVDF